MVGNKKTLPTLPGYLAGASRNYNGKLELHRVRGTLAQVRQFVVFRMVGNKKTLHTLPGSPRIQGL
jgi:hypothetical protein